MATVKASVPVYRQKKYKFQNSFVSACCFLFVFCLKVHETLKEATSTECQEDSSDPKLRWLQKTQQLRVGPPNYFHLVDMSA